LKKGGGAGETCSGAKVCHDRPHRIGISNGRVGKRLSVGCDGDRARFEAAIGEEEVPVITTVRGAVCSTIQSSAASKVSVTILREMGGVAGTRIGLLLTTTTGTDTVSTQILQEYLKTVSKMLYSGSNLDETS
jgi:hypothetical protein